MTDAASGASFEPNPSQQEAVILGAKATIGIDTRTTRNREDAMRPVVDCHRNEDGDCHSNEDGNERRSRSRVQ